jgi:hypothetical protein
MSDDGLSPRARFYRNKIAGLCADRADLDAKRRQRDQSIADLCAKARDDGIPTGQIAKFVTILDRDGRMKSVTRQAVEQMIRVHAAPNRGAAHEGGVVVDVSVFE